MASNVIPQNEWQSALDVLQRIARDPSLAPDLPTLERVVEKLGKQARKRRRRAAYESRSPEELARLASDARQAHEGEKLQVAQLVGLTAMHQIHQGQINPVGKGGRLVGTEFLCHICQQAYGTVHSFYHKLCPVCAEENFRRREDSCDLVGRIAVVTGGRVKIGFATALKLLRMGGMVHVTTRFAADAAQRFSQQRDYAQWAVRLQIHGLDFMDPRTVLRFSEMLTEQIPHLDILINNAAQTVRRTQEFYAPALAANHESLALVARQTLAPAVTGGVQPSPSMSTQALAWFGNLDRHGQPEDFRDQNSWTMRTHEIPPGELLETLLINTAAPFLLVSQLKPLFLRSPNAHRFIINATGLDGRFQASDKTVRHPHVNMSKAALNMLTRTAAADYAKDGIYMNSVDTGWVSDENGYTIRQRKAATGWTPPLDEHDAAARLCAPILDGQRGNLSAGLLLRHFRPTDW